MTVSEVRKRVLLTCALFLCSPFLAQLRSLWETFPPGGYFSASHCHHSPLLHLPRYPRDTNDGTYLDILYLKALIFIQRESEKSKGIQMVRLSKKEFGVR